MENESVSEVGEGQEVETTSSEDLDHGISPDLLKSLGIEPDNGKKYSDGPKKEAEQTEEVDESSGQAKAADEEFEITINGATEKFNREKMIELAQKGYDYTKKTMEVSDQRRVFEKERNDWETSRSEAQKALDSGRAELNELIQIKQVWDFYLDNLEKQNPDLHYQIMEGFNGVNTQFNNPIMKMQMEQLNKQMEQFKNFSTQQENTQIRNQFEKEYSELGERYKDDFEKLGLKVNRDKILSTWQKLEHAEKNSVHDAFILLYGDEMMKALRSKALLGDAKKKVESSRSAPTVGKVSGKKETVNIPNFRNMTYDQIARAISSGDLA